MSGLGGMLRWLFSDLDSGRRQTHTRARTQRSQSPTARGTGVGRSKRSKVEVLQDRAGRPPVPYWQLRGWRRVAENIYLGHFKTRLGRCHGVIKWNSKFNYGIYIHNVPNKILKGPHRECFTEVKSGKFRVRFARKPQDLNEVTFYMEILIREAFQNG